ncbi:hypothetical protein TanjilG_04916 [Lupinus angustifolius]|uniref:Uncharacterized protein n=1 Tax=Lupinus angustifolius TaxID=3871 RepID=A0A394DDZ7_LUPAN|nr:hypothetical protein TanjilG_04916 [Lupinus angustifolius]
MDDKKEKRVKRTASGNSFIMRRKKYAPMDGEGASRVGASSSAIQGGTLKHEFRMKMDHNAFFTNDRKMEQMKRYEDQRLRV